MNLWPLAEQPLAEQIMLLEMTEFFRNVIILNDFVPLSMITKQKNCKL